MLERDMTVEEVALGFVEVANETMCRPIRALTQGKGRLSSRFYISYGRDIIFILTGTIWLES